MVYTVMQHDAILDSFYELSAALFYIGRTINQGKFGCMLLTVKNVVGDGYYIDQHLEFV
jgi:hypothetical protein